MNDLQFVKIEPVDVDLSNPRLLINNNKIRVISSKDYKFLLSNRLVGRFFKLRNYWR